jgi:hypothetical protein
MFCARPVTMVLWRRRRDAFVAQICCLILRTVGALVKKVRAQPIGISAAPTFTNGQARGRGKEWPLADDKRQPPFLFPPVPVAHNSQGENGNKDFGCPR